MKKRIESYDQIIEDKYSELKNEIDEMNTKFKDNELLIGWFIEGNFNDKMQGFYLGNYIDLSGLSNDQSRIVLYKSRVKFSKLMMYFHRLK